MLPLGVAAADAAIQNKIYGSVMTTLIILNKEIKGIMEIAKHIEKSGLFNKGITNKIENELK